MSRAARTFILVVAAGIACIGIAMTATLGGGWPLIAIAAILALSVLIEGRYRGASNDATGTPGSWQRTGEREVDSETGDIVEVWYDPRSGRRRYEALGYEPLEPFSEGRDE